MDDIREYGERYGLSSRGLHQRLYTGAWRLVRPLDAREHARVARACQHFPERVASLLACLDLTRKRFPDDREERWAQQLMTEAEQAQVVAA